MLKPINYKDENCESKSSNCIIWAGPKIECISLCTGDSVTEAINNLATELCEIMNQLNLTNYDLTCLGISGGQPKDFKAFINILIQKICASSGTISDSARSNNGSFSNVDVTLAACFQYNNPSNGDRVTTAPITDYVQLIGIRICTVISFYKPPFNQCIKGRSCLNELFLGSPSRTKFWPMCFHTIPYSKKRFIKFSLLYRNFLLGRL